MPVRKVFLRYVGRKKVAAPVKNLLLKTLRSKGPCFLVNFVNDTRSDYYYNKLTGASFITLFLNQQLAFSGYRSGKLSGATHQ